MCGRVSVVKLRELRDEARNKESHHNNNNSKSNNNLTYVLTIRVLAVYFIRYDERWTWK